MTHTPHDRTIDYGLRALAEVSRYKTSAEPMAYEVWYSHVSGQNGGLSAALRARLKNGMISDLDVEELYLAHLSSVRISAAVSTAAAATRTEMRDLQANVRHASGKVSGYGDELIGAAGQLDSPAIDQDALLSVIGKVAETTKRITTSTNTLQERLSQTEANIASLEAALEATRAEAMTDGLTGLLNRRAFDEQISMQVDTAHARKTPLSLLMIDVDHFKRFNDVHGHQVGDQVLRLVASGIRQKAGSEYVATRYGGEEFAVIGFGRPIAEAIATADQTIKIKLKSLG